MAKTRSIYDRTCTICGDHYEFCVQRCREFANLPPWMNAYCSETCKDLYDVCAAFTYGWKDPQITAAKLTTIDYKDKFDKLSDWMKEAIRKMEAMDTTNAAAINAALADEPKKEETKPEPEKEENKTDDVPKKEEVHTEQKSEKKDFKKINPYKNYTAKKN